MKRQSTFLLRQERRSSKRDEKGEVIRNLIKLREHATMVERKVPMFAFKTQSEIMQLKHFLMTYYAPILILQDVKQLKLEHNNVGKEIDQAVE